MSPSSSSSSCSHWWNAPVYAAAAAAAAAIIMAAVSSSPLHTLITPQEHRDLALALDASGFHTTAVTLSMIFSSPFPPNSFTLFALPDSAFSNLSLPAAADLLRRHISPLPLPLSALASMPRGAPIPTLLPDINLTLTGAGAVTINGLPISHPDLFVAGPHVVHGVAAPFPDWHSHSSKNKKVELVGPRWDRVVNALKASKGYVSFSVGLSAVLASLSGPSASLEQATVFAPASSGFDYGVQAVRRHVAVGRYGYRELVEMQVGEGMRTVGEKDWELRITDGDRGNMSSKKMVVMVNGVKIVEPEVYVDDCVVVHGIAINFPTVDAL